MQIREIKIADAKAILEIYNWEIKNGVATFDEEPFPLDWYENKIQTIQKDRLPFLVAEIDSKIVGYCYLAEHRTKSAYRFTKEITVYVHQNYFGKGIGKALYNYLFLELKTTDIKTLVAGITVPNNSSIALHKKFGFTEIGVFKAVGYKFNQPQDVLWMEKHLK